MAKFSKGTKYTALCLTGGLVLGTIAYAQNNETKAADDKGQLTLAIAEDALDDIEVDAENAVDEVVEDAKEQGTTLALAEPEEDIEDQDAEEEVKEEAAEEVTEEPTEEETEEPTEAIVYDQLETTAADENSIQALDVSEIVEECIPSIVAITNKTVQEVQSFYYGKQEIEAESAGSGFIIAQNDTELLIATNHHVVDDANEMTVCFTVEAENPEDLVVPAVTKGTSSKDDLAVIAVKLADIPSDVLAQLKIATLGSSDKLKVGETSIVIGNALGSGQTVTCGIVSALEREITTEETTFDAMQTDAAINFGCSGGPIFNKKGQVIGITDAKAVANNAESMGYAIPIDTAIPVLQNLINRETRAAVDKHGYMGITVVPVSDEAKNMYNMPAGAYIYEVIEGSAAEIAGLEKGDIITCFDGISISDSDELVETLGYYEAGETVTVEYQVPERGGYVAKETEVTLQEGTEDQEEEALENDKEDSQEKDGEEELDPRDFDYDEFEKNNGGNGRDRYYGNGNNDYYDFFDFFFNGRDNFGF